MSNFNFKNINSNFNLKGKGFTLVETLVAITVFTLSVLALMVILGGGLRDINYAKNKITATYLAQEGIEVIRNMRDTFVLYDTDNLGWSNFKNKMEPCNGLDSKGCYFVYESIDFGQDAGPILNLDINQCVDVNVSPCPELRYNPDDASYGYQAGDGSGFWRVINYFDAEGLDNVENNSDEVRIVSTVYWKQASGFRSVSFSTNLFNWTQNQ